MSHLTLMVGGFMTSRFSTVEVPDDLRCAGFVRGMRLLQRDDALQWFHHASARVLPDEGNVTFQQFGVADGHVLFHFGPSSGELPKETLSMLASLTMQRALLRHEVDMTSLESRIEEWIDRHVSYPEEFCEQIEGDEAMWVLKFFGPRYLEPFLATQQLMISTTAGFTWGDAVYVTPLKHPCSTMMYGRAGVMGYIKRQDIKRVFRADLPQGLALYRQWIPSEPRAFGLLTTTVHSAIANRILRNRFSRRFGLDLVVFKPDQTNRDYVQASTDKWFAVYDWSGVGVAAGATRPRLSSRIQGCKWVAVVADEFEPTGRQIRFRNYFGEQHHQIVAQPSRNNQATLIADLRAAYASSGRSHDIVLVRTD
jgi:hypothetical protein